MIDLLKIVEGTLNNKIECEDAIQAIEDIIIKEKHPIKNFKAKCGYRLLIRFNQLQNKKINTKDFAVSLRQFIIYTKQKVKVSENIAMKLQDVCNDFGLIIDYSDYEVQAVLNEPSWFRQEEYIKKVYNIEGTLEELNVIGDNLLNNLTSHDYYKSFAQKIAVQTALNMPKGSSMLACLPTGSGKSLIGQMLSFISNGLTVVVVPTVALAIDQLSAAIKLKLNKPPKAYYGGMSYEEKRKILEDVKNNNISVLYISPEALMSSSFCEIMYEAASNNIVDNLIIDEAHLVIDWGQFFRTEFQLLSIFRKKLIEYAEGKINTLLLSATYTDNSVNVLKNLFSEEDNWLEIRADSLRKEPMYSLDVNKDFEVRIEHTLELIHLLPRPLILYVTTREDAKRWYNLLTENGFSNVEQFTGKTGKKNREEIINKWKKDEIDLIIATSAFGMGVDKQDVRTILHACIPESPNRFYQEVGRGGRDGIPSISVVSSFTTEDKEIANHLTKNNVLNTETILSRWESLFNSRTMETSDTFWIDTSVKPTHFDEDQITGLTNINWNEYVILFLTRHRFLKLLDFIYNVDRKCYEIKVKINDFSILTDDFTEKINNKREYERELIKDGLNKMKKLIDTPFKECWSNVFSDTYPLANENCNGCPYCHKRKHEQLLYDFKLNKCSISRNNILDINLNPIDNIIGSCRDTWIYFENSDIDKLMKVLLNKLTKIDINKIIIPQHYKNEWKNKKELFNEIGIERHFIFSINEIKELINLNHKLLLSGYFVIIYDENEKQNNNMFEVSRKLLDFNSMNRIIHISSKNLYISSYNKNIIEIIDGYSYDINHFIKGVEYVI